MMILSAEYSHGQGKIGTTSMMPSSVLQSSAGPVHGLPHGAFMASTPSFGVLSDNSLYMVSNKNLKIVQSTITEVFPQVTTIDGSVQNSSPQSYRSEGRSEDSGHAEQGEGRQTNATLRVLACSIMAAPDSPQHASLGFLTQPILGPQSPQTHSPHQGLTPRHTSSLQSSSPQQRYSPQHSSVLEFLPGSSSPHRFLLQQSASLSAHNNTSVVISVHPPIVTSQPVKSDESDCSFTSSTEMDMYYNNPLRGLQKALQKRGMMGPLQPEQRVNGEKPLQCPLCPFSTSIRSAFNNHLISDHSEQVRCHICHHTSKNHVKLREHLRVEHDLQVGPDGEITQWGEDDKAGVTTPKVNSQGKVKTYRCKQCEFNTVTKVEFWEHTRGHIKPERLLTCTECPFVTEYRHHLEYHLRNHLGSKPFKCDKCSYSCVNKSMLNSHLKSHSNIYQFRCSDCAYAAKYCHCLKLHLRKSNHSPAMVLNPDGSPNPLPIVDVYGTRRGPRRPKKAEDLPATQQPSVPTFHPMFSNPNGFLPGQTIPYPYNTIVNTFHRKCRKNILPASSPLLPFPNHTMIQEKLTPPKSEQENSFVNAKSNTIQQSAMNNNEGVKECSTRAIITQQEIIARTENIDEESTGAYSGVPLDLSRPELEKQVQIFEPSSDQMPGDQTTTTKNWRKGKAFKLERIAQRLRQQSSDEEEGEFSSKRLSFDLSSEQAQDKTEESIPAKSLQVEDKRSSSNVNFCEPVNGEFRSTISEERKERWRNVKEIYDCSCCDILFGDVVTYTMHMGYHGYQNPYTCNICGHQTSDRVQFFLHLTRNAHR